MFTVTWLQEIACKIIIIQYTDVKMDPFCLHYRVDKQLCIKVADFGLSRDVYMTEYYRQQGNGKVPAKWMAPESLHDRISNEQTDVVRLLLH